LTNRGVLSAAVTCANFCKSLIQFGVHAFLLLATDVRGIAGDFVMMNEIGK